MKGRALVAGFATRHVAQSAFRAGYAVCAVDHFCDQDLNWYTQDHIKFDELEELPAAVEEMSSRHQFDLLIVTSGAEDLQTDLSICGTSREKVAMFLDKLDTQAFFEELGVPVPGLMKGGDYPAMVKPRRGAGGWRNAIISGTENLVTWQKLYPGVPYLLQEVIEGIPSSVCCVTDGTRARAITTNEQILRGENGSSFGFSGSITPLIHREKTRMMTLAEKVAAASGCRGTIGVDFVCGTKPCAIEINPRFQATVDTVEQSMGCNMFQLHVDACRGVLPKSLPRPLQFSARSILFADRDLTLRSNLARLSPIVADIPYPDTYFEKEQAIVSVYGWGKTKNAALLLLDKHIKTVQQYLR
ncbi:MAG: ATP-grasp domain-containing protein [Methanoregula sp.]|nr:MAG: ATP-grasp domain-containing protein [Methanoregula sp.]